MPVNARGPQGRGEIASIGRPTSGLMLAGFTIGPVDSRESFFVTHAKSSILQGW